MPNWTEQNLLDLINNQQEEHIQLDFKRAAALARTERDKNEISKDVSAFANTIGGTILYGIQEAQDPPHPAAAIDPVDPNVFTKEWLEQVINSRIQPRISGVFIDPIPLPVTRAGQVVYRVVIPESATAHQASDKKYYRRFNFESVAMEDHEIRQAMFRLTKPSYRIFPEVHVEGYGTGLECFFAATILNTTEITGHDCTLLTYVPIELRPNAVEHEQVVVLQVPCVRLSGHTGVILPPGSVRLDIRRSLILGAEQVNALRPISIFFRIYDSFGLALFERFSFTPATVTLRLEETLEVGRKMSAVLP